MLNSITTKFASVGNARGISSLAKETFAMTYNNKLDPKDMNMYIAEQLSPSIIEREIEKNEALYLLIYEEDKKIGYVKLTWDETPLELSGKKALKIDKFYLIREKQRQGIGTMVMDEITEMARKSRHEAIWLKVWEKNEGAIEFYTKIGFEIGGKIGFDFSGKILNDYLLMRAVEPVVEDEIVVGY